MPISENHHHHHLSIPTQPWGVITLPATLWTGHNSSSYESGTSSSLSSSSWSLSLSDPLSQCQPMTHVCSRFLSYLKVSKWHLRSWFVWWAISGFINNAQYLYPDYTTNARYCRVQVMSLEACKPTYSVCCENLEVTYKERCHCGKYALEYYSYVWKKQFET